jgi:hypothetical protein
MKTVLKWVRRAVPPDTPAAPFVALVEYYRGWDGDGAKS